MSAKIFLSTVSDEFRAYRDQLRGDLTRPNVEVKVQEDFKDLGRGILDELDVYIAHCDAVVHLAGDMTGSDPGEHALSALRAKYPDLAGKLPPLGEALRNGSGVSYTQWEAWLALYHGKLLFIAEAADSAARGPKYMPTDASRAAQAGHLARLKAMDRYPGCTFASPDNLAKYILSSAILDLLVKAQEARDVSSAVAKPSFKRRVEDLRLDYLGDADRPVPFGGRDHLIQALNDWLKDPRAPANMLITAPAGRGKTALLVRWLNQLAKSEPAAFVPISIRYGTNREATFYETLAKSLADVLSVRLSEPHSDPVDFYKEKVIDLIGAQDGKEARCLLVIDGLDEASGWDFDSTVLPRRTLAGVRIVASARRLAGDKGPADWLRRLGWARPEGRTVCIKIPLLDHRGILDVLRKQGIEPADDTTLVDDLYRVTDCGDPLLLSLLVADLLPRVSSEGGVSLPPRLEPPDLQRMEKGFGDYFAGWLEEQRSLWARHNRQLDYDVLNTILAILSCANGPVRLAVLAELIARTLPKPHLVSADDIAPLRRFIIGDGNETGYVLAHPKLALYLQNYYFGNSATITKIRQEFVAWGRDVVARLNGDLRQDIGLLDYALLHHAQHLEQEGAPIEAFLELLTDGWRIAWDRYDGTYRGFAADIHHVWKALRRLRHQRIRSGWDPVLLAGELRCSLYLSSIRSIGAQIGPLLLNRCVAADLMSLSQAANMASLQGTRLSDAHTLQALGAYLSAEVCFTKARHILNDALAANTGTGAKQRYYEEELSGILAALASWIPEDLVSDALRAAHSLRDDRARAEALIALAHRLAGPEDALQAYKAALQATTRVSDIFDGQALAIASIVPRLPPALADDVLNSFERVRSLNTLATALAAAALLLPTNDREPLLARALRLISESEVDKEKAERAAIAKVMVARALPTDHEAREALLTSAKTLVRRVFPRRNKPDVLAPLGHALPPTELDQLLTLALENDRGDRSGYESDAGNSRGAAIEAVAPFLSKDALASALDAVRRIEDGFACAAALAMLSGHLTPDRQRVVEQNAVQFWNDRRLDLTDGRDQQAFLQLLPWLSGVPSARLVDIAQSLTSEPTRSAAISAIARGLPEPARATILTDALTQAVSSGGIFIGPGAETRAISNLVGALPDGHRGSALRCAIDAAASNDRASDRVKQLGRLVPHLEGALLEEALKAALAAANSDDDDGKDDLRKLPDSMLPYLLDHARQDALQAMEQASNPIVRLQLLSTFASSLGEAQRKEGMEVAKRVVSAFRSPNLSRYLAYAAPLVGPTDLEWFRDRLLSAWTWTSGSDRVVFLSEVLARFPELRDELLERESAGKLSLDDMAKLAVAFPDRYTDTVLRKLREPGSPRERARCLTTLSSAISPELCREVAAMILHSVEQQSETRDGILDLLQWLSPSDRALAIGLAIEQWPTQVRRKSLQEFASLSDEWERIGGESLLGSCCKIVVDIAVWWP